MKKRLLYGIASFSLILLLGACGGNKKDTKGFDPNFSGYYTGQLPCADCVGIKTKASFFGDNKVAITSQYIDTDSTSTTEWGTWELDGKLLKALMPNQETYYYQQLSDSVIQMTDSLGESSDQLAEFYKLKKQVPLNAQNFLGSYAMDFGNEPGAYQQYLLVEPIDGLTDAVQVSFSSEGAGKGCEFTGKGRIINDQIEVSLNDQHDKMKSTMVIRFVDKEKTLFVFTSNFDDRYDLMYFCGGGGSLAGNYVKK